MLTERASEDMKENEPVPSLFRVGTTLYVRPEVGLTQEEHDNRWKQLVEKASSGSVVELQYELPYSNGHHHSLPDILRSVDISNVHAPINNIDLSSTGEETRKRSVEETKEALGIAERLGVGLILHLSTGTSWRKRREAKNNGLRSFGELVEYKVKKGISASLIIENLEEPNLPAGENEMERILKMAEALDPNVEACLDIAHFWHNRVLRSNRGKEPPIENFEEEVYDYLERTRQAVPINTIHIGGAYVEQRADGDIHETHAYPGIKNGSTVTSSENLSLDRSPPGFKGDWMDIERALEAIERSYFETPTESKPDIILEIHDRTTEEQQLAANTISQRLQQISANREHDRAQK